jgi:hypothetical protein
MDYDNVTVRDDLMATERIGAIASNPVTVLDAAR